MLKFYWSLGRDIVTMQAENKWGNKFFKKLSYDLKQVLPGIKGLSETNLGYSKRFFILYNKLDIFNPQVEGITNNNLIHPQAEGEIPESILWKIPWGHHKYIIDKFYNHPQKALFFVKKVVENNWSRNVLLNFLDTDLFERQGKAITNFSKTLPNPQGDLAQEITKDPYNFDFLSITENYREKELKDALESSIQPIGISEYELSKLYPTDIKSSLPSIEDIEKGLLNSK